eukprot:UC1_evm3s1245
MEDYLLYHEVGRGSHSVTYKGRKTGTMEYVAIQRLDASQGRRACLRHLNAKRFEHENVLPIYHWCETHHEHWLVMSLCPGGDLISLLSQDVKLPESAVRSLGCGLAHGLQACHAEGVLVRSLQPANILIGQGHLVLADLADAQIIVPHTDATDRALAAAFTDDGGADLLSDVGLRPYMAPEILAAGGEGAPFSLAADLWALGCILYEMYAGMPPMVAARNMPIGHIHKKSSGGRGGEDNRGAGDDRGEGGGGIPLAPLAGASSELIDLLLGLLDEDPSTRMLWEDVAVHEFWQGQLIFQDTTALKRHHFGLYPAQLNASLSSAASASSGSNRAASSRASGSRTGTAVVGREAFASGGVHSSGSDASTLIEEEEQEQKQEEYKGKTTSLSTSAAASGIIDALSTTIATTASSALVSASAQESATTSFVANSARSPMPSEIPTNMSSPVKPTGPAADTIATTPTVRMDPDERPLPALVAARNRSPAVGIPSPQQHEGTAYSPLNSSSRPDTSGSGRSRRNVSSPLIRNDKENSGRLFNRLRSSQFAAAPDSPRRYVGASGTSTSIAGTAATPSERISNRFQQQQAVLRASLSGLPATANARGPAPLPPKSTTVPASAPDIASNLSLSTPATTVVSTSALAAHVVADVVLEELYIHESDLHVVPIATSSKGDRANARFDAKALGFVPLSANAWVEASPDQVATHLAAVEAAIGLGGRKSRGKGAAAAGSDVAHARVCNNVMGYLYSVCTQAHVANAVASSPFFAALPAGFKLLPVAARERTISVLGQIARQATVIEPTSDLCTVFHSLSEALRNNWRTVALARALVAAIGELLFYVSSQAAAEGDEQLPTCWRVPSVVYKVLGRCIGPDEDPGVQLHAVRSIDNVASVLGEQAGVLASNSVALQLWTICLHSKSSALRRSCVSAIGRLGHLVPAILQHVADKGALQELVDLLGDHSVRLRQSVVTLLLGAFTVDRPQMRLQSALGESAMLVSRVMRHFELAPPVLKAKYCLLLANLAREGNCLRACVQKRLVSFLERIDRHSSEHVAPAPATLADDGPQAQASTTTAAATGRGGGSSAAAKQYLLVSAGQLVRAITQRALKSIINLRMALEQVAGRRHPAASQIRTLSAQLDDLPMVSTLVSSPLFRDRLVNVELVTCLATLLQLGCDVLAGDTSLEVQSDALLGPALSCVELLVRHPHLLLAESLVVRDALVPALCTLVGVPLLDESRAAGLRVLAAVIELLGRSTAAVPRTNGTTAFETGLERWLLPTVCKVLSAPDPLPAAGARLLVNVIKRHPAVRSSPQMREITLVTVSSFRQALVDAAGEPYLQDPTAFVDAPASVQLIATLVSDPACDILSLCAEHGLGAKTAEALRAALRCGGTLELFEPLVELAHIICRATAKAIRTQLAGERQARIAGGPATLTTEDSPEVAALRALASPLIEALPPLVGLLCDQSTKLAVQSGRCILLLVQLFPGTYPDLLSSQYLPIYARALRACNALLSKAVLKLLQRALTTHPALAASLRGHEELAAAVVAAGEAAGSGSANVSGENLGASYGSLSLSGSRASLSELPLASLAANVATICEL